MRLMVCVKDVLDPELPASAFGIADDGRSPQVVGPPTPRVMDSYAENALETAVQIRDAVSRSHLTAVCVGDEGAEEILRRALAFTADAAIRIWNPAWVELDSLMVARILARAMQTLGGADLVLCGRQASDIEQGVVGPALGEELGVASVTVGRRIEVSDQRLRVEREVDGLVETVELPLPAVLSMTSSAVNVPRMVKIKDVMLSRGKPVRLLGTAELGLEGVPMESGIRLEWLRRAEARGHCELIGGADPGALGSELVRRLREHKVI